MNPVFLIFLVISFTGCASHHFLAESKDVWIESKGGADGILYFCRGNPTSDGASTPICVEAAKLPVNPKIREVSR